MDITYAPADFATWRTSKVAVAFQAARDEFPDADVIREDNGIRVISLSKSSFGNNLRRNRLRVAIEYALEGFDEMVAEFQVRNTVASMLVAL